MKNPSKIETGIKPKRVPEIRIGASRLFMNTVSAKLAQLFDRDMPLKADMDSLVEQYRQNWEREQEIILSGMQQAIGLEFYRPVIDANVAPFVGPSFSDPLTISARTTPEQFTDVLTHELIHVLLTDNTIYTVKRDGGQALKGRWEAMFGGHNKKTLNHIPVHAIHKYIYLDALGQPERLAAEIEVLRRHNEQDYLDAWDYVEQHGYEEILELLKDDYLEIAELMKGQNES